MSGLILPDGADLYRLLNEAIVNCERCIDEMPVLAERFAEATRDYKVSRRQRIVYERDIRKTAVSLVSKLVDGYKDIAELEYAMTCAEEEMNANKEAVMFHKHLIGDYKDMIEWERQRPSYRYGS